LVSRVEIGVHSRLKFLWVFGVEPVALVWHFGKTGSGEEGFDIEGAGSRTQAPDVNRNMWRSE